MRDESPGANLELVNIAMAYDGHPAVVDVSAEIRSGEFITFLGPSGSGKTTTLNLIAGFLTPTAGEILIDGQDIARTPPHRRNIGIVFQNYALFPHMTAYENVAFPLRRRGVRGHELRERVTQALELVQLGGKEAQYPGQLSGGQQQRVAFARAVVFNPRLLLMDEPLGALDRRLREALQQELKRLHQRLGITFIYVTHDQEEALVLSQRIVVFNHGRIQQIGTPTELYEQPANLFVAEFLGDSTQHRGTVRGGGEYVEVISHGQTLRARNTHGLRDGEEGVVIVRPERVILGAISGAGDGNTLRGRVASVEYLGAARRVELVLPHGETALAMLGARDALRPEVGDQLEISWLIDDAVLLSSGGSPSQAGAPDPAPEKVAVQGG